MKDKKEFLKQEFKKSKDQYKNFEQYFNLKITDVISCYNCQTLSLAK